jgi:membrane-associated phospholipid phosphatase
MVLNSQLKTQNSKLILNIFTAAGIIIFCNYFVDIPLALSVKGLFTNSTTWSKYASDIPDALFYVVCATTLVSFVCYLVRTKKQIFDRATRCLLLVTFVVPISYGLKALLKFVFGRVNTRVWLENPELYGFHWFHGGSFGTGFPSGHMAVFTALIAALWRFYPRYKPFYLIFSLLLATALIATNYHFLGDVVGGAYLGIFVEAGTFLVLNRRFDKF